MLGFAISRVLSVLGKVWKPIFFIVGFALIIGFSIAWIISIISFFIALPFANIFFAGSRFLSIVGMVNVLTLIGVPLLSIIMFLSKHIFKTRTSPNFRAGMWAFWIVNVISLIGLGSYQVSQFASHSSTRQDINLSAVQSDTLFLNIDPDPYRGAKFSVGDIKVSDEFVVISRHVHLNIQKAEGMHYELEQETFSRGQSEREAMRLASTIKYDLKLTDNVLTLPRIFELTKGEKWRNQYIKLTLRIPEGKYIHLQDKIWGIGYHIDIDRSQEYPHFEANQTWQMQRDGLVNNAFLRKSRRSDEFKFKDFEKLQIDGEMKVIVEKGASFKIELSGKPTYLDKVKIIQLEQTLTVTSENNYVRSPIRVKIIMPELKALDISGTDDVKVQGFTQKSMRINHRGHDELKVLAKIDSLYLRQSDRSKVTLSGEGIFMDAHMNKVTKLDADRFRLEKLNLVAGVSTRAKVAVSDTLWLFEDSGARVDVDGSPEILESNSPEAKKSQGQQE